MLFHHKTHSISSRDVLPNTKLNDMKTIKFSPENHLLFLRVKLQKIYIILMHIRCCRGKVDQKFKIFDNKKKMVREKSRECHNHKTQPFPDPKRKRKPTNLNKHKSIKRTKSTKISSLFPERGNRHTKRTEKHKNKMTHGKTYNKSPRRINRKARNSKTNTGNTALERSVE